MSPSYQGGPLDGQVGYDQSMRAFALDLMRATPEQRVDALLRVIEVTL